MSVMGFNIGMPGMGPTRRSAHRIVFRQDHLESYLAGGRVISGADSRDVMNVGAVHVLQAGTWMGELSSGEYAPSFVGVVQSAYTSGGTSLTVTATQATEISRLLGTSGTAEMVAIGPPTANGTVAVTDIDHSAINTSTGVLTVTDLGVDKVAGTLIAVKDTRRFPRTLVPDGTGIRVTDIDGNSVDVPFPHFPIAGVIFTSELALWPSDTSIQQWIIDQMNNSDGGGKFVFDSKF